MITKKLLEEGEVSVEDSVPSAIVVPSSALEQLADRARAYAEASSSANTRRACASDWRHFAGSRRRQGIDTLAPDPQVVGLYVAACASGATGAGPTGCRADKVSTIERRLSALVWAYAQRGRRSIAGIVMSRRRSLACATPMRRRPRERTRYRRRD